MRKSIIFIAVLVVAMTVTADNAAEIAPDEGSDIKVPSGANAARVEHYTRRDNYRITVDGYDRYFVEVKFPDKNGTEAPAPKYSISDQLQGVPAGKWSKLKAEIESGAYAFQMDLSNLPYDTGVWVDYHKLLRLVEHLAAGEAERYFRTAVEAECRIRLCIDLAKARLERIRKTERRPLDYVPECKKSPDTISY